MSARPKDQRLRWFAPVMGLVVILILATAAATQESPDFSGAWSVSTQAAGRGRGGAAAAGTMGSGWGPDITIRQDASSLTVERVFFARGDLQPAMEFRYSLEGFETTNTILMGRGFQEQVSTAAWDGETLVITTVQMISDEETGGTLTSQVEQRLSLRQSTSLVRPPSLVVETTRGGVMGGPSGTTRTIYTKR